MGTIKLVRVDNIQQAFDAGLPLYTSNGQYKVERITLSRRLNGVFDVGLSLVEGGDRHEFMEYMTMAFYQNGVLFAWHDKHPLNIMADEVGLYRAEMREQKGRSLVGATPTNAQDMMKRDDYLREALYPNYTEHVMD